MQIEAKATRLVLRVASLHMLMWLIMLIGLAGILVLAAAAYLALLSALSPAIATALTGVILLAACVTLILAVRVAAAAKTRTRHVQTRKAPKSGSPPTLPRSAPGASSGQTTALALGALVAGVACAASPRFRRFLVYSAGPALFHLIARTTDNSSDRHH